MTKKTLDVGLGVFDIQTYRVDYQTESWEEEYFKPRTLTEVQEDLLKRLIDIFCYMYPDQTNSDFYEKIFNPSLQRNFPVIDGDRPEVFAYATRATGQQKVIHQGVLNMIFSISGSVREIKEFIANGKENTRSAWIEVARANYHLGVLEGILLVDPAITRIVSERAKAGVAKRDEQYEVVRKYARELAEAGRSNGEPFPSRRQAVLAIQERVIAYSLKHLTKPLKEENAFRTIDKWLSDVHFAGKV